MLGKHLSEETKHKISVANSGEKGGSWIDGRSFLPYCKKFNEGLKEQIRNRDNRTCQCCGDKENGSKLHVHHIHYDKLNCYPDLISLCMVCHNKTQTNRDYWETFFINLLKERGLIFDEKQQKQ